MQTHIRKNLITSLIYEMVLMVSGLILPRFILRTFGSEVNGLVNSITQFLTFIALFEGGIGAVVLAEFYKPLEEHESSSINGVYAAAKHFFRTIGIVFIAYIAAVCFGYPLIVKNSGFSYWFVFWLIIIIGLNTIFKYFLSMTNRLLLQAEQKLYIPNIVTTITTVLNLVLAITIIKVYPSIHAVKLGSALVFLIQPLCYAYAVKKDGIVDNKTKYQTGYLKNRWSGFFQNLATYVAQNTDIIVLTVFATLSDVSVYSVYMLALNAVKSVITSVTNSYQSVLGKYIAQHQKDRTTVVYSNFEHVGWDLSSIMYSTCLMLIIPFVRIYTSDVYDTNYIVPAFAVVMTSAQFIYCTRESSRLLVLAGGKFKETNFGSFAEAFLNLGISIILVWKYGLLGVAVGTLISVVYRLFYLWNFLSKDTDLIGKINRFKISAPATIVFSINIIIFFIAPSIQIRNLLIFAIYGVVIVASETVLLMGIEILFGNGHFLKDNFNRILKKKD